MSALEHFAALGDFLRRTEEAKRFLRGDSGLK
jgi:hypothetical protein